MQQSEADKNEEADTLPPISKLLVPAQINFDEDDSDNDEGPMIVKRDSSKVVPDNNSPKGGINQIDLDQEEKKCSPEEKKEEKQEEQKKEGAKESSNQLNFHQN